MKKNWKKFEGKKCKKTAKKMIKKCENFESIAKNCAKKSKKKRN